MDQHAFTWMGASLVACASGALWWPAAQLLCVADLHLGRSERLARRGGTLLPPFDAAETIDRLAAEMERRAPATVVFLGDSFDDARCEGALAAADRERLLALMAGRDWIWIAGNHDPGPVALGGRHLASLALAGITLRHAPEPGETVGGEIAGHLHPKLVRTIGGHSVRRPCFLLDPHRLILPAFGAYTGGLSAEAAVAAAELDPSRTVAILTGRPCLAMPVPPARAAARRPLERAS
jgi:uncharacterized protein